MSCCKYVCTIIKSTVDRSSIFQEIFIAKKIVKFENYFVKIKQKLRNCNS